MPVISCSWNGPARSTTTFSRGSPARRRAHLLIQALHHQPGLQYQLRRPGRTIGVAMFQTVSAASDESVDQFIIYAGYGARCAGKHAHRRTSVSVSAKSRERRRGTEFPTLEVRPW